MILISNDFCQKRKNYNFDPYNVLLAFATNIPVLLMTGFCSRDTYCAVYSERLACGKADGECCVVRGNLNGEFAPLSLSLSL